MPGRIGHECDGLIAAADQLPVAGGVLQFRLVRIGLESGRIVEQ